MPTRKSARKKRNSLPQEATITISDKYPDPDKEVEVTPNAGEVHFENTDDEDHRLRLWKAGTDPNAGIDILLPAGDCITIIIKKNDEFNYDVLDTTKLKARAKYGPIKN